MAAVETGIACHPCRAGSNPARASVCGSGRDTILKDDELGNDPPSNAGSSLHAVLAGNSGAQNAAPSVFYREFCSSLECPWMKLWT